MYLSAWGFYRLNSCKMLLITVSYSTKGKVKITFKNVKKKELSLSNNSDFLIPTSLQPYVLYLRYFNWIQLNCVGSNDKS